MHVLEEDKESLSDQLKVPTRQGCIHLKKKKEQIIKWKQGLNIKIAYIVYPIIIYPI